MGELHGTIFNIQRFSVHDGPGVRDVIFMKGCPLRCKWCSNPESQSVAFQLAYSSTKCIGCGMCVAICPNYALKKNDKNKIEIDRDKCESCFTCAKACCSQAMHIFGERVTVEDVFNRTQNQAGAWRTGNGITVSGGEPLMQYEFVSALLKYFKESYVSTAIETTGYASWEALCSVAQWCDVIFFDMKFYNPMLHQQYTGVRNELIKENLKMLSKSFPDKALIVRTPLIPGINDKEISDIVDFLKQLPHLTDYELLPYHNFGEIKYQQIHKEYELLDIEKPDKDQVEYWNNALRKRLHIAEDWKNYM